MSKFRYFEAASTVPLRIRIAVAVVSLSAMALVGFHYATTSDTVSVAAFPEQLNTRAELHPGESLRNVEFYPDKVTAKHAIAFNDDGTTTDYFYRVDSTLQTAETVRTSEDGKRVVIRHADIMPDGVTYKYDVAYFDDGVHKAKVNQLVDDKTQHRQFFHANGALRADQIIQRADKNGWKLVTASEYRTDSSLLSTFKSLENDGSERQTFNDKEVMVSSVKLGPWQSTYEEVSYQPDGKTPIRVMTQDHQHTEVALFRPDGTKSDTHQWYGPLTSSMMTVTTFDGRGIRVLEQIYMSAADKFRLYSINTYTPDGTDERRTVYFEIGGAASETVYHGDGSTWTRRVFGANGLLQKEFDGKAGNGTVATREYSEADNIRIDLPKEWLVMATYEMPKQIVPYVPQGGPY